MTDRERLTCLLSEYDFDSTFCNICKRPDDDCAVCGSERLADYLISNGVVVLPCKVGDIVYVCYEEIPIIHKKQICLIICQHSYGKSQLEFHCTDFYIFCGEDIGKTVFLTREEAEQSLNDMQKRETKCNDVKQGDKI